MGARQQAFRRGGRYPRRKILAASGGDALGVDGDVRKGVRQGSIVPRLGVSRGERLNWMDLRGCHVLLRFSKNTSFIHLSVICPLGTSRNTSSNSAITQV